MCPARRIVPKESPVTDSVCWSLDHAVATITLNRPAAQLARRLAEGPTAACAGIRAHAWAGRVAGERGTGAGRAGPDRRPPGRYVRLYPQGTAHLPGQLTTGARGLSGPGRDRAAKTAPSVAGPPPPPSASS